MTPTTERPSRVLRLIRYAVAVLVPLVLMAALVFRHYADPIARRRILRSVEERLGSPATLDEVHVTFRPGLHIAGRGLHIAASGPRPSIDVRSFQFGTHLRSLFDKQTTLVTVEVEGLSITIPPGPDEATGPPPPATHTHGDHGRFMIARVNVTDAQLVVQNIDPTQYPLLFHMSRMTVDDPGEGRPIHFEAILSNPKPIGDIHAHGLLGPFDAQLPRQTPVSGRFDFAQADLSSIDGVHGHLHGQGTVAGTIGELVVDGDATMPDFSIAPGVLRTALDTHFNATLDALMGKVTLAPVTAHLLHTEITAQGTITRIPAGHDIALQTDLRGRAEDLLDLVSPARARPLLTAALADHGSLHIPPGRRLMLLKLESSGQATLTDTHWSDPDLQQQVDSLSMRARGKPAIARDSPLNLPDPPSTLTDRFALANGELQLTGIDYRLPGATILMDGSYSLPAETLDFHGLVRTAADASHMTTGIKSLLLKPLVPFLRKPGAGMQLPISLTGSKSALKLTLDLEHRKSDDQLTPAGHN